ncbi:FtsX-like permease family protein [bacterium]|nr:FtsX-like permease family protein [bacterium]
MNDLKFAIRQLVRNPGFSLVVILTLGLGIGLNAAMFSLFNAVVLRPLPYPAPQGLVQVTKRTQTSWQLHPEVTEFMGRLEVEAWLKSNDAFAELAAYSWAGANLSGGDEPERIDRGNVSASFLSLLGIRPILGRDFVAGDGEGKEQPVAILSHGLWQRAFGSNPDVLGHVIKLDARAFTVVGVLPPDFRFPLHFDVLTPLNLNSKDFTPARAIGRLKTGTSIAAAQARLDATFQSTHSPMESGHVELVGLQSHWASNVRPRLRLFWGVAILVLAIACTNAANLLLLRTTYREKEMAIRLALGAGRAKIIRQLISESMLLATIAAIIGLFLAIGGKSWLNRIAPAPMVVGIDGHVLSFVFVVTLLCGVAIGLVSAFAASRNTSRLSGRAEGYQGRTLSSHRLNLPRWLVVSETALATALLVVTGLFVHSFKMLSGQDPGFTTDHVLSLTMVVSKARYPDEASQSRYWQRIVESLQTQPGVESVGANTTLPFTPFSMVMSGVEIEGQTALPSGGRPLLNCDVVGGDYFHAMRIPLLRGRLLNFDDAADKPSVVLINETFAKLYFPNSDPIGKHLCTDEDVMSIVGVVGDVRHSLDQPASPQIYRPFLQKGSPVMSLAIRTLGDPMLMISAVRDRIYTVDPEQPVYSVMPLQQRLADTLNPQRTNTASVSAMGALAVTLAMVGIYGVLSFSVVRRRHEIGVRMALGSQMRQTMNLIIKDGFKLTLTGMLIGIPLAYFCGHLISSLLWGITRIDPVSYLGAAAGILLSALLACWLPARRAAGIDPMEALRNE